MGGVLHMIKLTPKEYEILERIAEDKTNNEISLELGMSRRTVEYHISSIIRKLNAETRLGAVVTAIKLGLLRIK
ncbi:response regulator transcription factor [Lysinibacillus sp. OL1]|nr:response regulator transcription factor [Lysinibacillus sp. OL1]